MIALRKRVLANAVGRRVTSLLFLATIGILLHRLVGAAFEVPVPAMLAMDTVVLGAVTAASGLVVPRVAWSVVPSVIGIAASLVFPGRVAAIFSLVTMTTLSLIVGLWLYELRVRKKPPAT